MRVLSLLAGFCVLACVYSQSHDLVVGQVTYGDVLLQKINEYKYAFPWMVRSSYVDYPLPGQTNFAFIRAVYVKDEYRDGTGGYAAITAGGIGQRFVRIKLKSQRGSGFNFTVSIYGRY